jgi:hypothetical protein
LKALRFVGTYGTTAALRIPSCDIRIASSSAGGTFKSINIEETPGPSMKLLSLEIVSKTHYNNDESS